jgi:hypothetical protein
MGRKLLYIFLPKILKFRTLFRTLFKPSRILRHRKVRTLRKPSGDRSGLKVIKLILFITKGGATLANIFQPTSLIFACKEGGYSYTLWEAPGACSIKHYGFVKCIVLSKLVYLFVQASVFVQARVFFQSRIH